MAHSGSSQASSSAIRSPQSANLTAAAAAASTSSPTFSIGDYRGGPSPAPSTASSSTARRISKRDEIRSRNPAPKHVSKLETLNRKAKKSGPGSGAHSSKGKGKAATAGHAEDEEDEHAVTTDIGILGDAVYDEYLPPLVARIRRALVRSLRRESDFLAWHQSKVRTPFLDRFFVYTSLFGTHSFFLIFLPTSFWVGNHVFARGLVNTLAFGVYLSSAIKDLLCVPRPYSPPVTRLTIGSVHLEYGFLSTHSTNSVGMALYIYLWVAAMRDVVAPESLYQSRLWEVGLTLYSISVVYGRVYAGMHSIVDCLAGSALGAAITLVQWYGFDIFEAALATPGWAVPAVLVPACLFMVHVHPQPLDDCPCFEDAIAFISVVLGVSLGRWAGLRWPVFQQSDVHPLRPSATSHPSPKASTLPFDALIKLAIIVVGVFCIFVLRIVVKTMSKLLLPSIFRFADRTFGLVLPRRHYTASSEYDNVPLQGLLKSSSFIDLPSTLTPTAHPGQLGVATSGQQQQLAASARTLTAASSSSSIHSRLASDEVADGGLTMNDLHRRGGAGDIARDSSGFLSVPGTDDEISRPQSPASAWTGSSDDEASAIASRSGSHIQFKPGPDSALSVPFTHPTQQGGAELPSDRLADQVAAALSPEEADRQRKLDAGEVKHYDVDVMTKVLVYASIGFVTVYPLPAMFHWLGWTK